MVGAFFLDTASFELFVDIASLGAVLLYRYCLAWRCFAVSMGIQLRVGKL